MGDYDGDQVSVRGLWTEEANAEAEKLMNSKITALNVTGSNSRVMSKEIFNTCYELTREIENGQLISEEDQSELLKLTVSDINRDKMFELFASSMNKTSTGINRKPARFNTHDIMIIPPNYYDNKLSIKTTVGRFIFNKYVLEGSGIINVSSYINETLGKKGLSNLDTVIGEYLLNDNINRKQFNLYIDRRDTIGLQLNAVLAHTISPRMAKPLPVVTKRKQELIKKYKKEIDAGNIDIMKKIEEELVTLAKEELKDDPGMNLYDSGDLDFGNNYKNNSIIKGPVKNNLTDEYDFIGSSFMDGIEIKDLPAHANSVVSGVYPGSIKTADAGYLGKRLMHTLQMVETDEPGTDCGTKRTVPITITRSNSGALIYKYFKNDSGTLSQLLPENIKSYIGKTLNFRSPMACTTEKICSICASELFYKLGTRNIGLHMPYMSHADLNLGLKSKHNANISLYEIDPNNIVK